MAKLSKNNKSLMFDPFADLDSEMVRDVLGPQLDRPVETFAATELPELFARPEPVLRVEPGILVIEMPNGEAAEESVGFPEPQPEQVLPVEPGMLVIEMSPGEAAEIFDGSPEAQPDPELELQEQTPPLLEFLLSNLDDLEPADVLTALMAEPPVEQQVEAFAPVDEELSEELFKLVLEAEPGEPPVEVFDLSPADLDKALEPPTSSVAEDLDFLDEIVREIDEQAYQPDQAGDVFGLTRTAALDAATLKRHVVFSIGSTEYAVPILTVSEVVRPLKVTPVPNVPEWVLGVANLRGDIISVVDLRVFFGQTTPESLPSNRMLVVHSPNEEVTTGLIVDRASGIFDLPQEQIRSPSAPIDDKVSPFMHGVSEVNDRLLVVLNLNQLLLSTEMQQFQ